MYLNVQFILYYLFIMYKVINVFIAFNLGHFSCDSEKNIPKKRNEIFFGMVFLVFLFSECQDCAPKKKHSEK